MTNTTTGSGGGDGTLLRVNGNNFDIRNRETTGHIEFATNSIGRMRI